MFACVKTLCQHQQGLLEGAGSDQPRDADGSAYTGNGAGNVARGAAEGQLATMGHAAAFSTIHGCQLPVSETWRGRGALGGAITCILFLVGSGTSVLFDVRGLWTMTESIIVSGIAVFLEGKVMTFVERTSD